MTKIKKKHINLITYRFKGSIQSFYISDFSFRQFFEAYGGIDLNINIIHFYGSDDNRNYEPKDVSNIDSLSSLYDYIHSSEGLILNKLEFEIFGRMEMTVHFNDDFECRIASSSTNFWDNQLNPLLIYLAYDSDIKQRTIENEGRYLAIDRENKVVAIFDSFDDYLKSNYTTDY